MTQTILIAGASGGIGRRAVEAFTAAGWTVRRYDRSTDLTRAAEGADVIFNGLNPPMYRNWPVEIPRITGMVIRAAQTTGATVLMPGTVYVYGDQPGPWTEATPHRPVTRKGEIRAQMERDYRAAGVRTLLVRAGDFIDPQNPQTLMNLLVLRGAARGSLRASGDPRSQRAYAFLPDLARAMVALAERRAEFATFEEVGFPGYSFSYAELASIVGGLTGRTPRVTGFPWWALRLAGPVWGFAREMSEMRYLHDLDHRIDGARFRALLPEFRDTPLRQVVAAHLPAPLAAPRTLPA